MNVLLIPSATLVQADMRKKFGEVPPALVPLADLSMIENILHKFDNKVDKSFVIAYEKKELLSRFIEARNLPVEVISLDELQDLGYTIRYGLEHITNKFDHVNRVVINFADTLVEDKIELNLGDSVFTAKVDSSDIWTYFKEDDGVITDLLDKETLLENPDDVLKYEKIFVGNFSFVHPEYLLECLKNNTVSDNKSDSFYKALITYSQKYHIHFYDCTTWYDIGHSDMYFKAKTGVAARSFNTISIDDKRGVLRKTSQNKAKLIDEIKWYLKLPDNIQYLAPRIYDYSLNYNSPYASMEFYGYHTLHESYLYGELPLVRWREIFKKLYFVINDMQKYSVKADKEIGKKALYDIYVQKTFDRLNQLKEQPEFSVFFDNNIIINNKEFKSLNYYLELLPKLVDDLVIGSFDGTFTIIHGDLCFTNILIEDNHTFMRLIDPRGSFGPFDIYGDPRYELAKLLHSLEGRYDFIIEDMFEVKKESNRITYSMFDKNNAVIEVFNNVFQDKLEDIIPIRLIEATLFLSMVPLHSDFINRQYIMLATGVMLLESVLATISKEEK